MWKEVNLLSTNFSAKQTPSATLTVLAQLFISCELYALKSIFFQELQDNRMKSRTGVIKHQKYMDTVWFLVI